MKDLIIEGDFDKLEWAKNNKANVNFKVIHEVLSHRDPNIKIWFESNYDNYGTIEYFNKLLDLEIRSNSYHSVINNNKIY